MAQSNSNAKNSTDEVNPTVFHDFLGRSCASDSSPAAVKPAASASVGPISATSDLGSERQVSDYFEGVPFYGPRSDLTGTEISNRFAGNKRSNSDSAFLGSSRDGLPHVGPDSLDGVHLMKMLRNAGGERPKRSHEEAMFFNMYRMRPTSTSHILHPPSGSRTDATVSKWERTIPLNVVPTVQYPPRVGQVAPFGCQVPSNRFKDASAGPSVISQAAADEGSRTGIKGSGILSSINARSVVSDRSPSEMLLTGTKQKSGIHNSEPESSTPSSRHGLSSACRQMTIFYGGQAHVFDDVHPNKADVIMALAGSNGGSWSTTYLPKSAPAPGESYVPGGENETGMASNFASPHDFRRRLSNMSTSSHGFGTGDQISGPLASGIRQGNGLMKDEKVSVQAAESRIEEKREA
ncbi:protein TIFY 8 isoform X1 [Rhododendron vialii]|uniref:protein TIFY 8 isoform X1 n=1 Tax=Rhododendron vialii TaxID=182163 RepID=UPI00265FFBC0|nr:protein TIFY 8 isoform X1 [Rhododendron vialii]